MIYGTIHTPRKGRVVSQDCIRGSQGEKSILLIDEFQNLNFHELDSIITRWGDNCKIMFCGDATQSDLQKTNEKNGIVDFMKILQNMPSVDVVEFDCDDIVRSGLCREYILAKNELNIL